MSDSAPDEYNQLRKRAVPERVTGAEQTIGQLLRAAPIPDHELAENISLFYSPRILKRVLYFDELYRRILPVHGVVMQFGVRWGRDIAVLDCLRHIYEPFNISRNIIGFDTFEGFQNVHAKDGRHWLIHEGALGTAANYLDFLQSVTDCRRSFDALPQLEHCELVQGDAGAELERWLERHPEAIVALAHFDMDIYAPTKRCLELLRDRCTKGSILAFDELNSVVCPGETVALREVHGLSRYAIQRSPSHSGQGSFIVID